MKLIILFLFSLFLVLSCSSQSKRKTVTISASNIGEVNLSHFDKKIVIYSEVNPKEIEVENLNIHQGHFLKFENTKVANEKIISDLSNHFHLVNLSLEDIAIAVSQNINFESFPKLIFLNSSVVDLKTDQLFSAKNIFDHYQINEVGFIGLSDHVTHKKLDLNRFFINDSVLSILKIKKKAAQTNIKSFVLIHHFQNDIATIMERLPPSFINSMAN